MLINQDEFLWSEKYRPKKIDDCILPEDLKKTFKEYVNKGEIPNLLFYGTAGLGKTTVAKAMCEEVGCDYLFINGSSENGIDTFRNKITNYASSMSLSGGRKVIIIDESEYLNPNSVQPALRSAMEEFSTQCTFIFTCNYKNRIIEPLHSRFAAIEFKIPANQKAKIASQFFKRVEYILTAEKITYKREVVAEIIKKYFPDNRKILNELQKYSVTGNIDEGILAQVADADLQPLVNAMKSKDFTSVKKWCANNSDNDPDRIFRKIYDNMSEFLKPNSIPPVILILSKYQYQKAFCTDQEINLIACLVEILIEAEFV